MIKVCTGKHIALTLTLMIFLSLLELIESIPAVLATLTDETPIEDSIAVTPTDETPTEDSVYESIIALKGKYPEGMRYTNAQQYSWNGGLYNTGKGCVALAFILSDAAFGNLPARYCTDFSKLKVGDVVRINKDKHSVIILKINGSKITVAVANYNSSDHWGRVFTYNEFNNIFNYALRRYPTETVPPVDVPPVRPLESADDVIVPNDDPDNSDFFINLTTETINTTAGYRIASYSIDGGMKWKALKNEAQDPTNPKSPFHPTKLNKLFKSGKTTERWVSEGILSKNSDKQNVPGGDTPAPIVKFEKIDAAHKNEVKANKLSVNYLIKVDNTGQTNGNWILVKKNTTETDIDGIIFGPAIINVNGKAGKTASDWYKHNADGVAVSNTVGSKVVYFYKVAPKEKTGSSNWVASGAPVKFNVLGLIKAPKVRTSAKVKSQDYFSTDGITFMKGPNAKIVGIKKFFLGATAKKPRSAMGTA